MSTGRRVCSSVLIVALVLLGLQAAAQSVSSEIQGPVKGRTGAVIVGAEVTAMSPETGVMRFLATDREGNYYRDGLRAGSYELTIKHAGFKSKKMNDVSLPVNQAAVLDANLRIGSTNEQ